MACIDFGMAWHGMAWHGMAWHGMEWHGMAWHGMAWHIIVCNFMKVNVDKYLVKPEAILEGISGMFDKWVRLYHVACNFKVGHFVI